MTFALYSISWSTFITVVESVYSAVRTDSLSKADYAYSLKVVLGFVLKANVTVPTVAKRRH